MKSLILAAVGALSLALAGPALAGPVSLKANPVDHDGQVTLGDIFDGADGAAGVVVGRRVGPSIVFEASQLQAMARQAGLDWANPTGLRRVVVRDAGMAPGGTSAAPAAGAEAPFAAAAPAAVRAAPGQRVISRNDMVQVMYEAGGVRLTITGRAEGNAAEGQPLAVRNLQSNRVIDTVAVGPGQAIAGPAAQSVRAQQFAAR
ncbi:flagella basal body P-ring formation protein FlgA [Brevundimonas sp. FT23028]|uniref:flagella basal body P-ring formation protein FlgA n=1 Tax=Brevundimonas sp. FT23028 TaxID=3393748 RepID=UPI003B58A974